ncbi:MAG TPA: hypothetical protein VFH34_03595, partial [Anaerolineales bacterium]|nr:hypothetical protein [Anaerolineales bacterium]
INALTLGTVLIHLADQFEDKTQPDPEIQEVGNVLGDLRGSLRFALETKIKAENADYWAFISLGELLVLTAAIPQQVSRAYRKALTASRGNQFRLQSSLAQLEILRALDIRTEFVEAGIDVIQDELKRIRRELYGEEESDKREKSPSQEGMVFLFTGYMVNNDRKQEDPFPPRMEDEIKAAIEAVLDKYHAGPDDLAVTTGMDAGSEILFVECCVERSVPVQAYFPLFEGPYVREFVSPGGDGWQERFYKLRNDPLVSELYQPDCVGLPKEGDNVHERNNRWALYSALSRGIDKVRLIAVWDGKAEAAQDMDARLVRHMVDLMRDMGGIVEQINPSKLTRPARSANGKPATKARRKK